MFGRKSADLICNFNAFEPFLHQMMVFSGAPDKPCGVGRADANPKLLLNDT